MTQPPLRRQRDDRVIAGVCSGLAAHLRLDVRMVRIAMAVFGLLGGAGGLLYVWLWVLVPVAGETEATPLRRALTPPAETQASGVSTSSAGTSVAHSRRLPIAEILFGACLLVVGAGLVLTQLGVSLPLDVLLPLLAVLVGVGLAWWQVADRLGPRRDSLPRVLGALALVAVGVLMFFVTAREPSVFTVVAAALAVLLGVALALAPWLLRLNRELVAERAGRAREAERAEIAAHLHDSVLQTLALIQQRAEPGSETSRLARVQERELREWLFRAAGEGHPREALGAQAEIRAHADELEREHPVRFEIVSVGDAGASEVPAPLIAAAKEAMLNAARHAGGDVTVYLEVGPTRAAIDVTDRGPGFDVEAVAAGRMGVRESILGRMERAGGSARIMPGPGGSGAAVRLEIVRPPMRDEGGEHE